MVHCVSAIVIGSNEMSSACGIRQNFTVHDNEDDMWKTVITNFTGSNCDDSQGCS